MANQLYGIGLSALDSKNALHAAHEIEQNGGIEEMFNNYSQMLAENLDPTGDIQEAGGFQAYVDNKVGDIETALAALR